MSAFPILSLDLLNPLFYTRREELRPFEGEPDLSEGEVLFCFELNPGQYRSFEPEEPYVGPLIFQGVSAPEEGEAASQEDPSRFELPRGNYLFAQQREILSREDCIEMAWEIQKELLWRRLTPGSRLYLRYLFEDGRGVTQIFRPYK
ncbi:MAG: hypothetical protein LBU28_04070 [Spirochaetaceae bacterium]|nr:hypothetical protein [Spirochaetaceae bacterium]